MRSSFLMVLILLTLTACEVHHNMQNIDVVVPPEAPPTKRDETQDVKQYFKVIANDGSHLHNPAWQDRSGVEWATLMVEPAPYVVAEEGCRRLGGGFATSDELNDLAQYLGRDSAGGYHPEYLEMSLGGGLKSHWNLSGKKVWSSSKSTNGERIVMNGDTGAIGNLPGSERVEAAALCVMDRGPIYLQCTSAHPEFQLLTLRQIVTRDGRELTSTFRLDTNDKKNELSYFWQSTNLVFDGDGNIRSTFKKDDRELKFDGHEGAAMLTDADETKIRIHCHAPERP